jgi:hypothetical protein
VSSPSPTQELIDRARALLAEGRAILDTDPGSSDDILGLYENLRGRLNRLDDDHIGGLLVALSETVEELGQLAEDLDRAKHLRSALVAVPVAT